MQTWKIQDAGRTEMGQADTVLLVFVQPSRPTHLPKLVKAQPLGDMEANCEFRVSN